MWNLIKQLPLSRYILFAKPLGFFLLIKLYYDGSCTLQIFYFDLTFN